MKQKHEEEEEARRKSVALSTMKVALQPERGIIFNNFKIFIYKKALFDQSHLHIPKKFSIKDLQLRNASSVSVKQHQHERSSNEEAR